MEWASVRGVDRRMPVFVSFFTDAFYMREAWDLVRSLQAHGQEYCAREVADLKSWGSNTNHKPQFLLGMDEEFPGRSLVWVDADARMRAQPTLLHELAADVEDAPALAYHTWRGPLGRHGACSGTVFLAPGATRRRLLREWDVACRAAPPEVWDQESMARAALGLGIQHAELPVEYCQIYDLVQGTQRPTPHPGGKVVIEHMQASRWRKRMRSLE